MIIRCGSSTHTSLVINRTHLEARVYLFLDDVVFGDWSWDYISRVLERPAAQVVSGAASTVRTI